MTDDAAKAMVAKLKAVQSHTQQIPLSRETIDEIIVLLSCRRCGGVGFVCENHLDVPWPDMVGPDAEAAHIADFDGCGGAGVPCPDCTPVKRAWHAAWIC